MGAVIEEEEDEELGALDYRLRQAMSPNSFGFLMGKLSKATRGHYLKDWGSGITTARCGS